MAITSGSFAGSFAKGLGDTGVESSSGIAEQGPSDLNAKITNVATTGTGVMPVANGPANSGS